MSTAKLQSGQTKADETTTTTTPVTPSITTTTTATTAPPIWSCDTHKRSHYQQRELKQQQLLLSTLLGELRRATHHWFQAKSVDDDDGADNDDDDDDATTSSFHLLVQTCVQILQHGLLVSPTSDATQRLIEDFVFLRPSDQQQPEQQSEQPGTSGYGQATVGEFLHKWVANGLRSRCLSRCIQSLVADKELLDCYYQHSWPYLRQPSYTTAFVVCLTAIQLDQSSLLSQLEPMQQGRRRHRRTCSQPNFSISQRLHVVKEEEQQLPQQLSHQQQQQQQLKQQQQQQQLQRNRWHPAQQRNLLRRIKSLPSLPSQCGNDSMDNLQQLLPCSGATSSQRPRCQTLNSPRARWTAAVRMRDELLPPLSGSSISTTSSCSHMAASPATRRRIQLINCDNIKIWTDQSGVSVTAAAAAGGTTSPPAAIPPKPAAIMAKRTSPLNSFLNNLFGSPPVYTSWYSKSRGQDEDEAIGMLDSFLPFNGRKLDKRHRPSLFEGVSMLDYNNCQGTETMATAPLDILVGPSTSSGQSSRGNSTSCSTTSCSHSSDSVGAGAAPAAAATAGNKIDDQSLAKFLQMSRYTHNNTELEKENAHFRISEACIAAIEHVKWSRRGSPVLRPRAAVAADAAEAISLTDGEAEAETETEALLMPYVEQHNDGAAGGGSSHNNDNNSSSSSNNNNNNNNSAEAVGLQLISRFNDQQLPKLGDLKWLVSEHDTPQQLLPMPKPKKHQQQHQQNTSLLLLQGEDGGAGGDQLSGSLTRGTQTWAPPRQQIIFTEHPPSNRTQLLTRQHYRCAGCGMHVTRQYQQHFRYCNYLGKFFCTGCHRNQLSAIPAKILQSWDFRCYGVSSFAYRLIEQMYTFPLFHVPDLNPQLYARQKLLARARRRRQQLKFVRDFIATCRFAVKEQELFNAVPEHITSDLDVWSMCDFVDVQNSSMCRSIEELIEIGEQHVYKCVLCTGRAFVCEYCQPKSPQLIYPWQRKVLRCGQCGACSHSNCWKSVASGRCQRCERIQGRT